MLEKRTAAQAGGLGGGGVPAVLLVSLATFVVVLGAAGCRGEPPRLRPPDAMVGPARSLDYLVSLLKTNAHGWASLEAECHVVIGSPRIAAPGQRAVLRDGRLVFVKPGKVNLTISRSGRVGLKLVGDGQFYHVDMPVFQDSYSGRYDGPVSAQPRRIHFLPMDLADALDPVGLLVNRAQTLTQWHRFSVIYSMDFVTEPSPAVVMANSIVMDRSRERILLLEKYNPDGSLKSRVQYQRVDTVPGAGDEPVEMPTVLNIQYPVEETTIAIRLENVKLNAKVDPELFRLTE